MKAPKPDLKGQRYYMLECECQGPALHDGYGTAVRARCLRIAAKHREECHATMRLTRSVTLVWNRGYRK